MASVKERSTSEYDGAGWTPSGFFRGVPHSPQNFIVARFSCWHWGHIMPEPPYYRPTRSSSRLHSRSTHLPQCLWCSKRNTSPATVPRIGPPTGPGGLVVPFCLKEPLGRCSLLVQVQQEFAGVTDGWSCGDPTPGSRHVHPHQRPVDPALAHTTPEHQRRAKKATTALIGGDSTAVQDRPLEGRVSPRQGLAG